MSFVDSAAELLDRAEASLSSLIADALKAKAYREVAAIAAMAESLAAISGRSRENRRAPGDLGLGATETAKAGAEPSWMRPKST